MTVEGSPRQETISVMPEELAIALMGSAGQDMPDEDWFVSGVLEWCGQAGTVVGLEGQEASDEHGLPLVVPGTRYAITLDAMKWTILRAAAGIIIDLVAANPINWTRGAMVATSTTVIGFLEKVERLTDAERLVLIRIGRLKRRSYRGRRAFPSLEEVQASFEEGELGADHFDEVAKSLQAKKLVVCESDRVRPVL